MKTSQKQLMTRYANELSAFAESHDQRARKQASRTRDVLVRLRAGNEPAIRVDRKRTRHTSRLVA